MTGFGASAARELSLCLVLQCRGAPLYKYGGVRFAESVKAFCRLLIVSLETALERKSRQEYHFCLFVWGLVIYYVFSGGVEPSGIFYSVFVE